MPNKKRQKKSTKLGAVKPMILTDAEARGRRPYQEDRHLTISTEDGTVIAVFDGHHDELCSDKSATEFPSIWTTVFDASKDPLQVFKELFEKLDTLTSGMESGSTATVVFIPKAQDKAYIAILGDSPVLVKQADGQINISPEHNARTNEPEKQAAIARGAFYHRGYIWNMPPEFDYARGLQMTRALGDSDHGKFLSRVPETYAVDLGGWLLVGSDGLVSPGHDESAKAMVEDIRKMIEDEDANAQELVDYAVSVPTEDNVTAILWRRVQNG